MRALPKRDDKPFADLTVAVVASEAAGADRVFRSSLVRITRLGVSGGSRLIGTYGTWRGMSTRRHGRAPRTAPH